MSWAGYERALPPEMIPHRLFDRLFGAQEEGWVNRKRSILDTVLADASALQKTLPTDDKARVDEHLSGIRDLERAIAGLPPEYRKVDPPDFDGDMKDWPRIAKLQSDLLVQALATRQTRVASYMLTKCQSMTRFPWLGYTSARHHDYTHAEGKTSGRRRSGRAARAARYLPLARGGIRVSGREAGIGSGRRWQPVRSHQPDLCARARRGESA